MPSMQRPPNYLLQALPAAGFDALHPHLKTIEMVRETVLVAAGSTPTQVYLPHSGAISITVRLSGGQVVEVATIGRDGLVGASVALGADIWPSDAVVLFPGTASVLDLAKLRAVADRNVTVRNLLARHELALFAQAQQSVACNASHSVEARLSRWLLRARIGRRPGPAADPGISRTDDRRTAQRDFDRCTSASAGRHDPLQPRADRNRKHGSFEEVGLRVLSRGEGGA